MKTLIVYSSQTGNTEKLAERVYETLAGEKEIFLVNDAPSPEGYDLVAVGFWLQAGKPDPKASEYIQRINGKQPLFLFATHGAKSESDHAKNAMAHAVSLAPGADIVGTFSCQGAVNPKVLDKISARPEPPVWLADAPEAEGHPDENDLTTLVEVINRLKIS